MALCGFNEKMRKGLTAFMEGLVEHGLQERSLKKGETIDQALKREISDMARLLLELHRIDDSSKRVLTEGLVKYAIGFYLTVRAEGSIDDGVTNYHEIIKNIDQYFWTMDDVYYSKLENTPDDMEQLAKILNETNA